MSVEKPTVAIVTLKAKGKTHSQAPLLRGATMVIGRGDDATFQINSSGLSRQHCSISHQEGQIIISDLQSKNGTFVNNKKITQVVLQDGDQINLGPFMLSISILKKSGSTPASWSWGDSSFLLEESSKDFHLQKPVIHEKDYPQGNCLCGKVISQKELARHNAIFYQDQIFCLSCFCQGKGNFPHIAGYRIVKKLGGGGMGEVFEAIQLSMQRPVAFKLMKGLECASEQQRQRFFREARTGGKLNHPNIVSFIDSGEINNLLFIVMEFVYGWDLRRILDQKAHLDCQEALRIAYYIAKALDHASRQSIIHRDIKPENILIDREQVVKLTDFGLAKNLEEAGMAEITKSQTGVGTLFYMAPEQIIDAKNTDHRADIYSLGVTLYEMISGRRPFQSPQMIELVNKIRYEEAVPLKEVVPDVPPKVSELVRVAMEKKASQRFQSSGEMISAIQDCLEMETMQM